MQTELRRPDDSSTAPRMPVRSEPGTPAPAPEAAEKGRAPSPTPVLMVGPFDERAIGGIAACVRTLIAYAYDDRLDVRPVDSSKDPDRHGSRLKTLAASLGAIASVGYRLARTRSGLVHIHTSSFTSFYEKSAMALIARASGHLPLIHIHGSQFDRFYLEAPPVRRRLLRWVLRRVCHRVIVLSDFWVAFMQEKVGVEAERLAVLHNPVQIPSEVAPSGRASKRMSNDEPVTVLLLAVLYPGDERRKGIYEFLDAAVKLRDRGNWRFRLAGPFLAGPAVRDAYWKDVQEAGVDDVLELVGPVVGPAKYAEIAAADMVVLPSYAEGLPIVMMEAMGLGVPVVVTPVGGIPDVVTHERNGLVIPAGDAGALARAIERLRDDSDLRNRLREGGLATFEALFSIREVGRRLNALYLDLLNPHG